ncbi:MAG: hypothetical protein OXT69_09985 [Candidatus Poribacteria bacterium]|nr:hypothetical protein [Candidatus Poribacteria bacterium]
MRLVRNRGWLFWISLAALATLLFCLSFLIGRQADYSAPDEPETAESSASDKPDAAKKPVSPREKWLVREPGARNGASPRYIGPQTAEAILSIADFDSPESREILTAEGWTDTAIEERRATLLSMYQRMLDRGYVYQDAWDINHFGGLMVSAIEAAHTWDSRREAAAVARGAAPDDYTTVREQWGLPETATMREVEDAILDHELRVWPAVKEQFEHAFATGEGTIDVVLDPVSRTIATAVVGTSHGKDFTDEEYYNISRHGIAPKGYRLRFVTDLNGGRELGPDEVPFFSETEYVKGLKDSQLHELLQALPSYLGSPEAANERDVVWLSIIDRYDAALRELAARDKIPEPAKLSVPSAPKVNTTSSSPSRGPKTNALNASSPPSPDSPLPSADKTEEQARRERIALAFLEALEAHIEKDPRVTDLTRAQIARRLLELRLLRQQTPPVSPQNEP